MDELVTQLHSLEESPKSENDLLAELYKNLQFLKYEFDIKVVSEMRQCSNVCKEITKTIEEFRGSASKNTK